MKGTILRCLEELVCSSFGKDKWDESLLHAGQKGRIFSPISDIDESEAIKIVESVCKTLKITFEQAADAFGDYWVNVYSQKLYSKYYLKHKTAKDFLLSMDDLHISVTKFMQDAKPPRFDFEWKNDKVLIMHYKSHRGLIDFLAGLSRGVGKFYGESLNVRKTGNDKIEIIFS